MKEGKDGVMIVTILGLAVTELCRIWNIVNTNDPCKTFGKEECNSNAC